MNQPRAQLTVRTAADILDVVPTLLGFIPTESLVVIYLDTVNGRSQIAMTARMDLPTTHDELTATLQVVEHHGRNHEAMILVTYSVDTTAADHTLYFLLDQVTTIQIQIAVSASAEGWAELEVEGSSERQPYRDASSQVTASIVAAGLQRPGLTRQDLSESVSPPSPSDAADFADLFKESVPMSADEMTTWIRRWVGGQLGHHIEVADAALLASSVQNVAVRDAAWAEISCADADHHINLWRQVARKIDGPTALPVLGLLGMAAWIGGQGALANLVLDRAAHTDSYDGYSLFNLLRTVLETGVNPKLWDSMRTTISATSAS